jgi:putative ABC transport system permease protein
MCFFNWNYLDEGLKSKFQGRMAGNAGTVMVLCKDAATMPRVSKAIDDMTKNSDSPTKTQTEEAFISMFAEMLGDMRYLIMAVGAAVVASLLCVAAVAMAMSMRERTTEIAVLKAIGYSKGLVLGLVLSEAILVAGLGGVLGAIGSKLLFDAVDIAPFTGGFLPVFYVPWVAALSGLAVSGLIGLLSGLIPAFFAANSSVINGLRKVV